MAFRSTSNPSVVEPFHPVSHGRGSFAVPERSYCVGRWFVTLGRVGREHASQTLGAQDLAPKPAAFPGEGLPGAGWRGRSTRLGQADAVSAATHGPTYRPGEDLTGPVVSMEAAMETEPAQAAAVVVSPAAVARAEQAQCAPGELASPVLADSAARHAAAAL